MFKSIKELKSLVNASRKALAEAEERVVEKNKLLQHYYQENKQLKNKIIDLENNIEILVNNLSAKKRELARPGNQH